MRMVFCPSMKERIPINRVASEIVFLPCIRTPALHCTMSVHCSSGGAQFCTLNSISEMSQMECGHPDNFLSTLTRHSCEETCKRSTTWVGFSFICHRGRRPRRIVAGFCKRGSPIWSSRAELFGVGLRLVPSSIGTTQHVYVREKDWEVLSRCH